MFQCGPLSTTMVWASSSRFGGPEPLRSTPIGVDLQVQAWFKWLKSGFSSRSFGRFGLAELPSNTQYTCGSSRTGMVKWIGVD